MEPQPPRSRRSKTNLAHLTLAPLSTRLPIDSDGDESPNETEHTVHIDDKAPGGNSTLSSYHTWRSSASRPHSPHYTSYIAGKSAPTTPGILSRGSSPNRSRKSKDGKGHSRSKGSKSYTALQALDVSIPSGRASGTQTPSHPLTKISTEPAVGDAPAGIPLTKARSSAVAGVHPPRSKSSKHAKAKSLHVDNAEWLFRAGTAISEGARESKGQTWLVSRESSTSLVAAQQAETNPQHSSDDEEADRPMGRSPYASRPGSRPGSRPHSRSRKTSRRGSHSSRGDLAALRRELVAGFTPVPQTPRYESGVPAPDLQPLTATSDEDYFSHAPHGHSRSHSRRQAGTPHGEPPGPDFVDLQNEPPSPSSVSSESSGGLHDEAEVHRQEDAEVAALARTRGRLGFGLGWVDRLVAWTVFAPHDADDQVRDTDIEGDDGVEAPDSDSDEGTGAYSSGVATPARGQQVGLTPFTVEDLKDAKTKADKGKAKAKPGASAGSAEKEEGGWNDAAWLLGVASKVIF